MSQDQQRPSDAGWETADECYYCGRFIKSAFRYACRECESLGAPVQGPKDDLWWRFHAYAAECKALADKERREYDEWSDSLPCLHGVSMDQECPECLRVMEDR